MVDRLREEFLDPVTDLDAGDTWVRLDGQRMTVGPLVETEGKKKPEVVDYEDIPRLDGQVVRVPVYTKN